MSTLEWLGLLLVIGLLSVPLGIFIAIMMPPAPDYSKYDHREDEL